MTLGVFPLLGVGAALAAGAAQAEIYIVTVPVQSSAPHKFLIVDGRPAGICPDLLRAIERVDPQLRFHTGDSTLSLPLMDVALKTGAAGAACALLDSGDRHEYAVRINTPIYTVRQKVAVRAGDQVAVRNLKELQAATGNKSVITNRGTPYSDKLNKAGIATDDSSGDVVANLRRLVHGRSRFLYGGEHSLQKNIDAAGMNAQVQVLPAVLGEQVVHFWVSRTQPAIVIQKIDKALAQLAANGELRRITSQYHGN